MSVSIETILRRFYELGSKFAEQNVTYQTSSGPTPPPKPKAPTAPDPGPSRSSVLSQSSTMTANTPNVRLGGGNTLPFTR